MSEREWDLLTVGRAAVDLYGKQMGAELEATRSFSKYLGGCPANIAVGTSRLGLRSAILSRVGAEAMGRFVRQTLREEGVATDLLQEDPERLTGLVLLGVSPPDHFPLIFYRENCADMAIDSSCLSPSDVGRSQSILLTGTHFSQEKMAKLSYQLLDWAKEQGTCRILDIDFRPVLWGLTGPGDGESRFVASQRVREVMGPSLAQFDLIVGTEEEFCIAAGEDQLEPALRFLRQETSATLVLKQGPQGCVVFPAGEIEGIRGRGFNVPVMNVLGAGDAFLSGFLRAWLKGESWQTCCTWANACGALVVSRHACAPAIPYWEELVAFVAEASVPKANALHRLLERSPAPEAPLAVLAFDHRVQFEELVAEFGESRERIPALKRMIFEALNQVKAEGVQLGLIVDAEYGAEVLEQDLSRYWVSQCVEAPGSLPLGFVEGREAASLLREWPCGRVIKVLAHIPHHEELCTQQIQQLKSLDRAVSENCLEMLLELIPEEDPKDILKMVRRLYDAGVAPSWWKLPPCVDTGFWDELRQLIAEADPHCRGVLILGQGASLPVLCQELEGHRERELVKGFAVGRTVWLSTLQHFLADRLDRESAVAQIAQNFQELIRAYSGRVLTP